MPTLVNCSACGYHRYVPEEDLPFGVRCPKCDATFMDPIVPRIGEPAVGSRHRAFTKRHRFATVWLDIILIASATGALGLLVLAAWSFATKGPFGSLTPWQQLAQAILCGLNAACAVALLLGKRGGFHGLLFSVAVSFIVSLVTGAFLIAGLSLVLQLTVLGVLFYALRLGQPSTWSQLE